MVAVLFLALSLAVQQGSPPAPATAQASESSKSAAVDEQTTAKLLTVKRIYVDNFGDDAISKQLQAMVINALAESKRFIITENKDKADAVLKGTGLEKTAQELHAIGDSTSVATAAGGEHGEISGQVSNGAGSINGSSSGGFVARKLGTSDSQASTETVNDARLAVRLVST